MPRAGTRPLDLVGTRYVVSLSSDDLAPDAKRRQIELMAELRCALLAFAPGVLAQCEEILHLVVQPADDAPDGEGDRVAAVIKALGRAFASGQLDIESIGRPIPDAHGSTAGPVDLSDLAPPPVETVASWLEICVVDEVGSPIDGLPLTLRCDGSDRSETTNGSGIVRRIGDPNTQFQLWRRWRVARNGAGQARERPRAPLKDEPSPVLGWDSGSELAAHY